MPNRSNPKQSFDQVKNILGKLDRSIDAARERRLAEDELDQPQTLIGREDPAAPKPGRARPMQRESLFKSNATAQKPTNPIEAWDRTIG